MDVLNNTAVDLPSRSRLGRIRRLTGKRTLLVATLWALNPVFASAQAPSDQRLPKRLPATVAQATLGVVTPRPTQSLGPAAESSAAESSAAWSAPRPIGRLAAANVADEPFPRLNPPSLSQEDAEWIAALAPNTYQPNTYQPNALTSETVDWGTMLDESPRPVATSRPVPLEANSPDSGHSAASTNSLNGPLAASQAGRQAGSSEGRQAPAVWQVYINTPPAPPTPPATPPPTPVTVVNMPPRAEPKVVDPRVTERKRIASLVSRNNLPKRVSSHVWESPQLFS